MGARILTGDMREKLAAIEPESVDAVICDPPYELTNGKRGGTGSASINLNSPAGRSRIGTGGLMGCKWDSSGVSFDPETWRAALRVAKPGVHLVAFGGSRTWHRIAVAIEDAGWDIRDSLIWWYAQGFPKSLDVAKHGGPVGWGTALKPSFEPIILARKPLAGTVAANVQQYGTGAINVEACRVGRPVGDRMDYCLANGATATQGIAYATLPDRSSYDGSAGRWPPNMLVSHADACVEGGPCADGCPAPMFGERLSTFPAFYAPKASRSEREAGCEALPARVVDESRDEGAAGRNTPSAGPGQAGDPRRNTHPTVKPISVMRWLVKLLTPPGGTVLDPFAGSGTTGCAAVPEGFDFVGIELDPAHVAIAEARIAHCSRSATQTRLPGIG